MPRGARRILIVEDEESIRRLLSEYLARQGFAVAEAAAADQALAQLDRSGFDLVLSDVRMPGMSGTELAAKIKTMYPQAHVVICTGYLVEAGCPEVRDWAEHVLHKPLNLGEVLELADNYSAT